MSAGWAAAAQAATEIIGIGMGQHGAREANKAAEQQLAMQFDFADEQASLTRMYNAEQAEKQRAYEDEQGSISRQFNASQAQQVRDWSEHMANTSYQRAVGDLRKAGLNPMLAYSQGGAPMPAAPAASGSAARGSAASTGNVSAPSGVPRANIAQAGLAGAQAAANLVNLVKQGANIDADTALKQEQANKETASAEALRQGVTESKERIMKMNEEIATMRSMQSTNLWRQTLMDAQTELTKVQRKLTEGQINGVEAQTQLTKINALLAALREPEARNVANSQSSYWMENIAPFLRSIGLAADIIK